MYNSLSEKQKVYFLEISGTEYIVGKLNDSFPTNKAYNDKKWENHSPWIFSYIIEPESGYFICELVHRMTNNRIFGWDREGNELSSEITKKYFTTHW